MRNDTMPTVKGYINVYVSGYYHARGKLGAYDRHGGDIYASKKDAKNAIHPKEYYTATVQVEWHENTQPKVNRDV
jgi:hypothetical protein